MIPELERLDPVFAKQDRERRLVVDENRQEERACAGGQIGVHLRDAAVQLPGELLPVLDTPRANVRDVDALQQPFGDPGHAEVDVGQVEADVTHFRASHVHRARGASHAALQGK